MPRPPYASSVDGFASETLGVVRAVADPDNIAAEFAIIVRSDLKGQGLGPILLKKLIDYCRTRGTKQLVGEALADNPRVIGLARRFGAALTHSEPGIVAFRIDVRSVRCLHDIRAPMRTRPCVRRSR